MNILFIGDIVGRPGRRAVQKWLPEVREQYGADLIIANAENAAGGLGATPDLLQELLAAGVHAFTLGNHTWRKKAIIAALETMPNIVRPANYPPGLPGQGATVLQLPDGRRVGLLNLIGRVYMEAFDCPFRTADRELSRLHDETNVILVDMHAEATSEKIAMGWHLDGRCSAVVGTHTHVQTADEWVMPEGTAYISDVGMCGPYFSVIGSERDAVLGKFITGMPRQFTIARGPIMFCAVLIEVNDSSGKALRIHRILERDGH